MGTRCVSPPVISPRPAHRWRHFLGDGRGVGLLWLLVLLLAGLLVWVRNGYGLLVVLLGGAALFAFTWWGSASAQSVAAYLVAWVLLLAAPRPPLEPRTRPGSAAYVGP